MTTYVSDPFGTAAERHEPEKRPTTAPSRDDDLATETPVRPGKLAYVCKMFPRITETFVLNEIVALHRAGVPVRIYSILPATRDNRVHAEAVPFASETTTLPQPGWRELPAFLPRLGRCLRARRAKTALTVLRCLLRPSRRSFHLLFRAVTLADHLRRDEVAHVHAAWAHAPASVSRVASRLTQIPWSMAAHAKDIYTTGERSLALKISSARFTLACTGAHRDHLREIASRQASRYFPGLVHLAYHGVDAEYFSGPPQPAPGRPIVLSVARLVAKKGLDVLIEAAALLRNRGVPFSLEIVGEGLLRPTLERKIRELELGGQVALRGLLTLEEVREAMRRSTCFALPCQVGSDGDRDGIPNSVAEAMACGLPVVSTRLPSIEELVTHEETGLLVPPGDAAAVAEALQKLLLDPEERRRLGGRARAAVVERFAANRCASERVQLLARALTIRRVLYLSGDREVPVRGGEAASIHVRSVIGAWRAAGVETLLVTANGGPPAGTEPACEVREARAEGRLAKAARTGARFLGGGAALERALGRLVDNAVLLPAARMAAREWRPDLVYERHASISVAGSLLARQIGKPHVVELDAPLADEEARGEGSLLAHLKRRLERWVLRRADLVIAVSPALREHARGLGVRPERIRVVPSFPPNWSDVARATLGAAEEARAACWGWPTARPLTVGYVVKMFPRFSETFILNEVLELERAGAGVVIFSMKPPAPSVRQPGVDRVRAPVIVLPERASTARLVAAHLSCFLRAPWRYARTAAYAWRRDGDGTRIKFLHAALLAREAGRLGVQHLHAHFATAPARQAKLASMLSGIPFSFTAHAKDLFWSGNAHRTSHKLKHGIRSASFVVAISEHNRRFMETLGFHVPRGRIATIYNGLDLEAWPFRRPRGRPATRNGAPPLILAVGRLVEKKGFAVLLEAISILADRGIRCRGWIAGEGPERERLSSLIRRRRLSGVVRLLGAVRQDRLAAELYSRAHVLAQPCVVARDGDQDGIPTVILEAMAVGLPVVATPVSGISEAVGDGESGLLVAPGDPVLLADAIARLLADDALATRLAQNARRVIEERFSLRENARSFLRRLRKSAQGPSR